MRGFTLVELLVSMALIIFIMVILTGAFTAGITTFRNLKSQGDMQEKLRATASLMRDDLLHLHFDQNQKLSTLGGLNQIKGGYFYIRQSPSVIEGFDGYGVPSRSMAPGAPPVMCFTVNRKPGIQPDDYFIARIPVANPPTQALPVPLASELALFAQGPVDYRRPSPPSPYPTLISRWAEVGYFLVPTGDNANGTPLYSLRRRVRVIIPDDPTVITGNLNTAQVPVALWGPRYAEVSCAPDGATGFLHFNNPADLTQVNRQAMPQSLVPLASANSLGQPDGDPSWFGDDLVMTDVISFNVRMLFGYPFGNDFVDVPFGGTYNTALQQEFKVRALEITMRVWDVKTNLTRQMTVVQDM
jgi:type II secretory pathway pseudopilin PulG